MPDDERSRRRLGDETKGRIADLASGWSVEPEPSKDAGRPSAATPDGTPEPARKKPKTLPPPPPGSAARKALEGAGNTSVSLSPASSGTLRTGAATAPPPIAARAGAPTAPPSTSARPASPTGSLPAARSASPTGSLPAARSASTTSPPPPRSAKPTSPPPIPPARPRPPTQQVPILPDVASRLPLPATAPPSSPPPATRATPVRPELVLHEDTLETIAEDAPAIHPDKLPVPVGEFDHGHGPTILEQDKLRLAHSQQTIKRDPANAILHVAEAPLTQVKQTPVELLLTESAEHGRGDPTSIDPRTSPFERGDPTQLGRTDATEASTSTTRVHSKAGRLRTVAALRRQRGIFGDVRYVSTALFGVRRARRELIELEAKQATRQQSRRRHLITLGRTAVISEGFDHPAVGKAREQLGTVEDERSRHTGQVAAADQELSRVHRDREAAAKQFAIDLAAIDAELAELARRLEPLLKEQATVTKRGATLRDQLRTLDAKIAETTASLVSVKGPKQDPAAIQAELATLKADRIAVQRDEPNIAAQLDGLNPRIAGIEAKRGESTKKRAELVEREQQDKKRTDELLEAIGAKRKVMDRAANDAETLRDKILFELGERLYVDRPANLTAQLSPIDSIDVELGTGDRRVMELREILSSIDKAKLARGIAVIALTLVVVGGFAAWLIYMLA